MLLFFYKRTILMMLLQRIFIQHVFYFLQGFSFIYYYIPARPFSTILKKTTILAFSFYLVGSIRALN